ncbi:MAG: hypothetical protein V1901_04040 [Patescibacteria group bacterium]
MIRKGKLAGEIIKYKDGLGGCLWYIYDEKTPDSGLCWDFDYKDLDIIIEILQKLKTIKPRIYKE